MENYSFLQKFRYNSMHEVDAALSEDCPHFFIRQSPEEIQAGAAALKEAVGVYPPQELLDFWEQVGAGQFFAEPPDEYAGRYHLLAPEEIMGVYLPDADQYRLYNTIRADARAFLSENQLLAFCEFDEYSALYLAVNPDEHGAHPVFSDPDTKIADSLADSVEKLLEEPDYFLYDEDEDDEID